MPKGVAVRIRARASRMGARLERAPSLLASHCSSGVELSIRNRAVVGSNPTSGSQEALASVGFGPPPFRRAFVFVALGWHFERQLHPEGFAG